MLNNATYPFGHALKPVFSYLPKVTNFGMMSQLFAVLAIAFVELRLSVAVDGCFLLPILLVVVGQALFAAVGHPDCLPIHLAVGQDPFAAFGHPDCLPQILFAVVLFVAGHLFM